MANASSNIDIRNSTINTSGGNIIVTSETLPTEDEVQRHYEEVKVLLDNGPPKDFESPIEDLILQVDDEKHPDYVCQKDDFHSRSKISDDCGKSLSGNIELSELFTKAEKYAKDKASDMFSDNSGAKPKYISEHGNIVAILGEGKVGKTKLAQSFFKEFKPNFECVFYIDIKDLKNDTNMDLLTFLLLSYDCNFLWRSTEKFRNGVLQYIDEISDKVCIIIDGLDHLISKALNDESLIQTNLYDSRSAGFFLKNILAGHLFLKSKKLITARSYNFYQLNRDWRPSFVVWAVGQNPKTNGCTQQTLQYLNNFPDIKCFCRLPLTWKNFFAFSKNHPQELDCITCVFCWLFFSYLDELNLSSCITTISLSKFILSHLNEECQKFVFNDEDLLELELPQEDEHVKSAFLTTFFPRFKLPGLDKLGNKQHYFSQILVQEFLQACALAFMTYDEFKCCMQKHLSPIFHTTQNTSRHELVLQTSMVFKFMCGLLSKKEKHEFISEHLSRSKKLKEKRDFLLELVVQSNISCNYFPDFKHWNSELHDKDAFPVTTNSS